MASSARQAGLRRHQSKLPLVPTRRASGLRTSTASASVRACLCRCALRLAQGLLPCVRLPAFSCDARDAHAQRQDMSRHHVWPVVYIGGCAYRQSTYSVCASAQRVSGSRALLRSWRGPRGRRLRVRARARRGCLAAGVCVRGPARRGHRAQVFVAAWCSAAGAARRRRGRLQRATAQQRTARATRANGH